MTVKPYQSTGEPAPRELSSAPGDHNVGAYPRNRLLRWICIVDYLGSRTLTTVCGDICANGQDHTIRKIAIDVTLPSNELIVLSVQANVILFEIGVELICSENFGDLNELIVVIMAVKERFFPEYLAI